MDNNLIKHSATIQIQNQTTAIQRKIYNICLWNAFPHLLTREVHRIKLVTLKSLLDIRSKNDDHLKDAFRTLTSTRVEFNLFNKDKKHQWGVMPILAQAVITDGSIFEYAYAPKLRELLAHPDLYARLNLEVQKIFKSKHAIALWEYLVDALGSKRDEAFIRLSLQDFRHLLAITEEEYSVFKDLKRRVLQPAIKEINRGSDISVTVKPLKSKRAIAAFEFHVTRMADRPDQAEVVFLPSGAELIPLPGEPLNSSEPEAQDNPLLKRLVDDFGFSRATAAKLLAHYDAAYIVEVLDLVDAHYREGKVQKSLTGYVVKALENDYRPRQIGLFQHIELEAAQRQAAARERADKEKRLREEFEKHQLKRTQEEINGLSSAERAELEKKFIKAMKLMPKASKHLKHALDEKGFDDPHVLAAFEKFAIGLILRHPEDCDFQAYKKAYGQSLALGESGDGE
jgi:hypothetical protein